MATFTPCQAFKLLSVRSLIHAFKSSGGHTWQESGEEEKEEGGEGRVGGLPHNALPDFVADDDDEADDHVVGDSHDELYSWQMCQSNSGPGE